MDTKFKEVVLAILIAVAPALALPALAQGEVPTFCLAEDPSDPDYDITDFDAQRDSDDWCKLAYHQPHKARRQLSKAVALVRSHNNPNRIYFNPKRGARFGQGYREGNGELMYDDGRPYIQLLRPWMVEQNEAGTHNWQVFYYEDLLRRSNGTVDGVTAGAFIVNRVSCEHEYGCAIGQTIDVELVEGKGHGPYESLYGGWRVVTRGCDRDRDHNHYSHSAPAQHIKLNVEGDLDDLQADCS